MRLADRHGKPLSQVAVEYPDWELAYWSVWFEVEPTDGERVELAIARFFQSWISGHIEKGKPVPKLQDLMLSSHWAKQAEDPEALLRASFKRAAALTKANQKD